MKRLFKKIWAVSMIIALMCPMTVVASPANAPRSSVLAEAKEFQPLPGSFSEAQVSKSEFGI